MRFSHEEQQRSIPEIHQALEQRQVRQVQISQRNVSNLLEHYDELLAVSLTDHLRIIAAMTKVILALVDDLFFQQPIEAAAKQLGYTIEFVSPIDDVIAYLVARQPWLVIVDLDVRSVDWEGFVIAAKTSPATRKIPILAFGSHMDVETIQRARKAGCDAVVSNGAFKSDVAGMILKHAKLDESEELLRQSKEPLPELAKKAIEQFNQGEFWEQHETFEAAWRAEPGPIRQLYQGILQVGVAYYQIQRQNYDGARKLFQRAWQYLNVLPDVSQGVDIAQLKRDAQAAQAEMKRLGPERIGEFDPGLFKPIKMETHSDSEGDPLLGAFSLPDVRSHT